MAGLQAASTWIGVVAYGLYSTAAIAVPPPPVPRGQVEAYDNIAKVAPVLEGAWQGIDKGPGGHPTDLRVGHFGKLGKILLIGRTVHFPTGRTGTTDLPISNLSMLTYAIPCHAFELVSLDRLGETQKMLNDCSATFPINLQSDGSLAFEYVDESRRRVQVSVKDGEWREDRGPLAGGFTAHRISGEVGWGVINK